MKIDGFIKRRHFFIKPHLQVRFIIFMVLATLIVVFFIHFTFELSIAQMVGNLGISIAEIKPSIITMRINSLLVMGVIVIVVGALTVLYFHNFLGPLFSLERSLDKIKDGDLTTEVSIRQDDQLKELADKIKYMVSFFKNRIREDRKRAQTINKTLENIIPCAKNNQLTPEHIEGLIACQKDSSQITGSFNI